MRAVLLHSSKPRLVKRPEPRPSEGDALVRVSLAGICGTDLEIARGYLDFRGVPGHEFVGVVEEAPDPVWVGKRVVGEINVGCGRCPACRSELQRHCAERTVMGIVGRDGAFAERLVLPLANLHPVPQGVSDEAAVFAEPLAAAYEILEQVTVTAGTRTLVLGDGRLGQLCAMVLTRAGAPPVVCGRHPKKMHRLRRLGLQTVVAGSTLPREFDLVVEATGSPEGLRHALNVVRPRGTVVLKSTYHGKAHLSLTGVVIDEVTVVGSRCGPFKPALDHLASDPALVDGLITERFPLHQVNAAFSLASRPEALKVLLAP